MDTQPIVKIKPHCLVTITVQVPYPKTFSYREETGSFGTAISRAVRKMRKELKGKRLKEVVAKAVRY